MLAALQGFLLCAGLILAIGSQAVFVLEHGLRNHHVFLVCSVCFVCDIVLITLGVQGVGLNLLSEPELVNLFKFGGIVFLCGYGLNALRSAQRVLQRHSDEQVLAESRLLKKSILPTLAGVLAVTLLNPHVYVDTVLLIGGYGANLTAQERLPYLIGALLASFCWFFGLGYGAGYFVSFFRRQRTQLWFHLGSASLMFFFSAQLWFWEL